MPVREAAIDLAPWAASAAEARSLVRSFLATSPDPELLESAELVVSELVTNAVLYAVPPIRLALCLESGTLRIEVHDGSRRLPQLKHNAPEAITGRGLHLVGSYGEAWGAEADGSGKSVWCEVRAGRPGATPGPSSSARP